MKKKDISSIFKNNVDKFDSKFTNWIIKKETNKNEDRNSLPGLSLLSRRGRERERRRAWSFFLGHPFETEVGSWNSRCWSGRLVKVETQAGRIWERERDGEFLKFDFKMKEKGRRAIEIFMGKMVFWKYEMCPILIGWSDQMWCWCGECLLNWTLFYYGSTRFLLLHLAIRVQAGHLTSALHRCTA